MDVVHKRALKVLLLVFVLPLFLSLLQYRSSIFLYRDALTAHYPVKKQFIEELQRGAIPYWNPTASFGQPLLANPNMEPFYPDNLLYLILPFDAAWNFHFWFHWIFGMFGIYSYIRLFKRCRKTGVLAAIWWGSSGFVLSTFSFYNLIAVTAWIPWAAILFYRMLTTKKQACSVLLGVTLGLQFLAGEPVTCLATWLLLLILAIQYRSEWARAIILRLVIVLAVAAVIVLPQMIALLEIYPTTSRAMLQHSFITSSNASLEPYRLFEWAIPYCWGPPFTKAPALFAGYRFTNFPFLIHSIHVGFFLILCFLLSLRKPRIIPLAGMALFFLLSVGRFSPLWKWLFDWIPHWSNIHFPVKFFSTFLFLFVVCAGEGFHEWNSNRQSKFVRRLLYGLLTVWIVVAVFYFAWLHPMDPFFLQQIGIAAGLLVLLLIVVLRLPSAVFWFVVLECVIGARYLSVAVDKAHLHSPVHEQVTGTRTFFSPVIFPTRHSFSNIGKLYESQTRAGFPMWGGPYGIRYAFDASMDGLYSYYNDYFGAFLNSLPIPQQFDLLSRLGVGQILTTQRLDSSGCSCGEYPGYYFYQCRTNPHVLFPVARIESKATIERSLTGLTAGEGPFARWKTNQETYNTPQNFRYKAVNGSSFELDIQNAERTFIVGRITYFPTWQAVASLADGSEVRLPVNQVDVNFLGFEVPAGVRKVMLFYSSRASKTVILLWIALTVPLCLLLARSILEPCSSFEPQAESISRTHPDALAPTK